MSDSSSAYLGIDECINGYLYEIHSRNLTHGVYRELDNAFVGIRTKFGERFLFAEFHWDTGPPYGTVRPLRQIGPSGVEHLREDLGLICTEHERPCVFIASHPASGTWQHLDDNSLLEGDDRPRSVPNTPLFDFLDNIVKS